MDDDDDGNQSRFLLDTSIIVPIGIAAGVTLLIVAFVYCCRYFVYSKRVARAQTRTVTNNRPTVYVPPSGVGAGRSVPVQPQGTRGVAANMAAIQQYLPWSHTAGGGYQRNGRDRGQPYPPPSSTHHHRTNYNSTRVSEWHN